MLVCLHQLSASVETHILSLRCVRFGHFKRMSLRQLIPRQFWQDWLWAVAEALRPPAHPQGAFVAVSRESCVTLCLEGIVLFSLLQSLYSNDLD